MIGRRTTLILLNTVAGGILGFVALKVFAVETGVYANTLLGQLAFAMGLAGLLGVVLDMGLGTAHIKRVTEGRDLATATASFALVKVLLAGAVMALAVAAALAAAALGVLQDTPRFAVVIVALFYALLSLRTIFTATFEGRQEFAKSQLTVLAENMVRAPLMALFGVVFGAAVLSTGPLAGSALVAGARPWLEHHAAELLAACYAAGALASCTVGWLLFRRGYPVGRPSKAVVRDYWNYARHIFLTMAVGTVYVSLDKVVITYFWGPANTGEYYGAQRFSDLIGMVPMAVYTVLFPSLSGLSQRGDRGEARGLVAVALRHISMVVMPLVAFTIALAGPMLSLTLTGQFEDAVPTLRLLAVYALLFALLYPYVTMLNALGRPDLSARAAIVATALNAALNLLLVPKSILGVPLGGLAERGSALATLGAVAVQLVLMRRAAHRLEGSIPLGHLGKQALAGVLMGAMLWLVAGQLEALPERSLLALSPTHAPLALMAALFGLGLLVYLGALALLREFRADDLRAYLHMLNPATMAGYVRDEVAADGPGGGPAQPPEPPARRE